MSIVFRRYKRKMEVVEEVEIKEPKRPRIGSVHFESDTAEDNAKMSRLVFDDPFFRSADIGNLI